MKWMRASAVALAVFAFLHFSPGLFAQQLFDSWRSYRVPKRPASIATADIDGDADLDLVIGHSQVDITGQNPLIVMKNNGAGFFTRDTLLYVRSSPVQVVVKDLDGDGDLDIVTADSPTSRISIFKNRGGTAGFDLPLDCPTGITTASVAVDFMNGDAVPDIVTANFSSGTASILINHGAATFPAETTKVLGYGPRSIVTFDFDNDGDKDIAAAMTVAKPIANPPVGVNGIVVMKNDTFPNGQTGAFDDSARVFYSIPLTSGPTPNDSTIFNPTQLVAADFNGDGYLDLALADSASTQDKHPQRYVSIFINRWPAVGRLDTATFAKPVHYSVGFGCRSIFAGDLDGDGDADIAAVSAFGGTVSILKNNGNGTFAAKVDYLTAAGPYWVDGGDYDRDGDIDLAVVGNNAAALVVLRNRGNGSFETGNEFTAGSRADPFGVATGDLDGDGDLDLALANQRVEHVLIRKNDGTGTVFSSVRRDTLLAGAGPRSIAIADLDGDLDSDLVVANQSFTSDLSVLIDTSGTGKFRFRTSYPLAVGAYPYSVVARDLDGDGDADLAAACFGVDSLAILKNNGGGSFGAPVSYSTGGQPNTVVAADFDRDGDWDLAVSNEGIDDRLDSVTVFLNDSTGNFPTSDYYLVGSAPSGLTVGDFNGDAFPDLAVTCAGTPAHQDTALVILFNNGNGTFAPRVRYTPAPNPTALVAADWNGDGYLDIAVASEAVNAASIFFNNGGGSFAPPVEYGCGLKPRALAAADLDADGDLDLVATNPQMVNSPAGLYLHGGFTVLKNQSFITCFARGDLNGDTRTTLADITLESNCIFLALGACPLCVADTNCDGALSPLDLIFLLRKFFNGTSLPC